MPTVTVADIRSALGELDTAGVDKEDIEHAIELAEQRVEIEAGDDVSDNARRIATIDIAKHRAFVGNREAFINSVQGSRDTTEFNISRKAAELREDRDRALELVRNARVGAATIGDRGKKTGNNHHFRGDRRRWL